MAHVVEIPLPFETRRLRMVLLVLLGIAALAVVMVGAAALLMKHHTAAAHAAGAKPGIHLAQGQVGPTSPVGKPTLSRGQTTVLILNGNGSNGAAGAAASLLRHKGYHVRAVGNARRMDYPQSLVMFRPGLRPEAVRFARDLGVKQVGPLDGMRIGAIHRAKLVYILGR